MARKITLTPVETPAEKIRRRVVEHGDQILKGTLQCKEWIKVCKDCRGCISELGCRKVDQLMFLEAQLMLQPNNFDVGEAVERRCDYILNASLEDLEEALV